MWGSIGPAELILLMFIILLVFGSKRLPELARGIGKGVRQFNQAIEDVKEEIDIKDIDKQLRG
ncbi:MAG TPA: twin-arginine translocase TatA/TatE family subunit [bacterium]|nr:twin-arginine translocase TatA/TatE family subunit [bacterium]